MCQYARASRSLTYRIIMPKHAKGNRIGIPGAQRNVTYVIVSMLAYL